jgi:IS5 family transposase
MARNYLKGAIGDRINLLMAAGHFWLFFPWQKLQIYRFPDGNLNDWGMHFSRQ